jgi:hypothetical protein
MKIFLDPDNPTDKDDCMAGVMSFEDAEWAYDNIEAARKNFFIVRVKLLGVHL